MSDCFFPVICVSILGLSSCDTFTSAAVAPQEWSVPAQNSAQSESFVSPEDIREPSLPPAGKSLNGGVNVNGCRVHKSSDTL